MTIFKILLTPFEASDIFEENWTVLKIISNKLTNIKFAQIREKLSSSFLTKWKE